MRSFEAQGAHYLIDFPGFGKSDAPNSVWGTADYADFIANWIKARNLPPLIWIGHSFGCRVGITIAARHPELIRGLFLISAAGLKRKKNLWQRLEIASRVKAYKLCKKLVPLGLSQDWLIRKFAAPDYKNATGIMRQSFVKIVNEDLSESAAKIACPTALIYGKNDSETPPEIGQRLQRIIPRSKLYTLDGQDHYSVLSDGRHQVSPFLSQFLKTLKHVKSESP